VIEVLVNLLRISRGQQDESESETYTVSLGSCDYDQVADNCVGRCAHAHKVQRHASNSSVDRLALTRCLDADEYVELRVHLYIGTHVCIQALVT